MDRLPQGWKTWNVHSVLSHVLMPSGLTLNLCVREYRDGGYLRETLVGRQGEGDEKAYPDRRVLYDPPCDIASGRLFSG